MDDICCATAICRQFADLLIVPQLDEVVKKCHWRDMCNICSDLFSPIITSRGFCFTFNMFNRSELFTNDIYIADDSYAQQEQISEWDVDDGYMKVNTSETSNLSISHKLISNYSGEDCLDPLTEEMDIKMLIHQPAKFPRAGISESNLLTLPFNKTIDIIIKPENIISSSSELKILSPRRERCYYSKERNLGFFKIYTRQNCLTEYLANHTLFRLGCVPYYMPHYLHRDLESLSKCDCLPSCSSIKYNVKTSETALSSGWINESHSTIFIYFEDMEFITIERKELFSSTDFWANCGGLLGLFIGFSFLSFVEVIYFITLRSICNVKKHGKHYWSG
ncbi:ASC domain containing protein, partial [Asbolus verrucosus]